MSHARPDPNSLKNEVALLLAEHPDYGAARIARELQARKYKARPPQPQSFIANDSDGLCGPRRQSAVAC